MIHIKLKHDLNSIQELSNKKHYNNFIVISGQTYINNKSKLKFYCKSCENVIEQRVDNHLNGAKCKICSHEDSFLKLDEVRKKIKTIFGDKYILVDQEIKGTKYKVEVFCKKCNNNFEIRLNTLLLGYGCSKCKYDNLRLNIEDIRIKSKKIFFNKFYIPDQEIQNKNTKIKIFCKDCDDYFYSSVANHLQGYGCKKCHIKNMRYDIHEIIEISKKINGDKYKIISIDYPKIKIHCKKCDNFFVQNIKEHIRGCGCSICNFSKGESHVEKFLKNKNIVFVTQKRFDDCRDTLPLPFDFYLPKLNTCVEYDGEQHFISKEIWGGENGLNIIKKHDKMKTEYCDKNKINLIRIKYNENIIEILENNL